MTDNKWKLKFYLRAKLEYRIFGAVCFLFLNGEFDLIQKRMSQRLGHYMPSGLLDSQFCTLEKPQADETDVITLAITERIEDLVNQALIVLQSYRTQDLKHSRL